MLAFLLADFIVNIRKVQMGKILIFPTDTVYGIGCAIFDKTSIEKIYEIKHRPRNKPLACLCANLNQINEIAFINDKEKKIVEEFMPGALTIILKAKDKVKEITGFDTIGVRIPNSKIAQEILLNNGPMLTTSVNESNERPLNDYIEIKQQYGHLVDEIFQSEEQSSDVASTVVSLLENQIVILREGAIKKCQIEKILSY